MSAATVGEAVAVARPRCSEARRAIAVVSASAPHLVSVWVGATSWSTREKRGIEDREIGLSYGQADAVSA